MTPLGPRRALMLFFVSGVVALGLETTWFRRLAIVFGATHQATGILLAAFMLGLAAGGALAGFVADRLRRPVLGYAIAELAVGLSALASPVVFDAVAQRAAFVGTFGRVVWSFALLAPPTLAMGATLPFLVAALAHSRSQLRLFLALLYGSNLLGATLGALSVGFVVLPALGIRTTSLVLGTTALAVSVAATTWSAPGSDRAASDRAPREAPAGSTLALVLLAVVGTTSFALQVAENRVLAELLGSASYTFALTAAVTLAGLGVGGLSSRSAQSERADWTRISRHALVVAMGAYLALSVVHVAPAWLAHSVVTGAPLRWVRLTLIALVVLPCSSAIGALFPALAARAPAALSGAATSQAFVVSTLGNVVGALAASFIALPRLGPERTFALAGVTALGVAIAAATRVSGARLRGTSIAAAAALVVGWLLYPRWDFVSLAAGTYRVAVYREHFAKHASACGPGRDWTERRVLFHADGALSTVDALGFGDGPECSLYSLRINGKAEGSIVTRAPLADAVDRRAPLVREGDLTTQILAGWLPAALGPPPRRALVVGWGTGTSVQALLSTGATHVDAVEIEPAVLDASHVFHPGLLDDPRIGVVHDDARALLGRTPPGSYDVIVSQPSNPWVMGSTALFSREYFQLLASRLTPNGRALVWVQLYEIDRDAVRSVTRTFTLAFANARAFRLRGALDLLLVGARSPEVLAGVPRLYPLSLGALASAGLDPSAVASGWLSGGQELASWAKGAAVNTDDAGWLEFHIADRLLSGTSEPPDVILAGL